MSYPIIRILTNVRSTVDAFVQEAEQFDDLTMLCFTYRGRNAAGQLQSCSSSYYSSKFEEVTGLLPNQYRKEKQRM